MAAIDAEVGALPGGDLVSKGLLDLAAGRASIEAMLLACAPERLREVGISLPGSPVDRPEARLYELVESEVGPSAAHSRYNALRRTLLSFLRAARIDAPASRR